MMVIQYLLSIIGIFNYDFLKQMWILNCDKKLFGSFLHLLCCNFYLGFVLGVWVWIAFKEL